jgi:hypothetical protein
MWQKAVMTTNFVKQRAAKQKCVTNRTQLPSYSQLVISGLDLPVIPTYNTWTSWVIRVWKTATSLEESEYRSQNI